MPDTLIQIRRASTAGYLAADGPLAAGEPAIDFNTGILYIGDGTSTPGISFESTVATLTPHPLVNDDGVSGLSGTNHTLTSDITGGTLRVDSSNNMLVARLGFYDLGDSSGIDFSYPTQLQQRFHWMNKDHVGSNSRAIFYTSPSVSSTEDMSHYPMGTDNSGKDGYSVEELAWTNSDSYAKVLVTDATNLGLSFRRLNYSDISGTAPTSISSITDLSGTDYRKIFYTKNNTKQVSEQTWAATLTSPRVKNYLTTDGTSTLSFTAVYFQDCTGDFIYSGASTKNNYTLKYDVSQSKWITTSTLKIVDYGGTISSNPASYRGITIDGSGYPYTTPYIRLQKFNTTSPSVPQDSAELLMISDYELGGISYTDGASYIIGAPSASTGISTSQPRGPMFRIPYAWGERYNFRIYTTAGPGVSHGSEGYRSKPPNVWLKADSSFVINFDADTPDKQYGLLGNASISELSSLHLYALTTAHDSTTRSTLPEFSMLKVGDISIDYTKSSYSSTTNSVNGIKVGSISISGTSSQATLQDGYLIKCGSLTTKKAATGLFINEIESIYNTSTIAGIHIQSIKQTENTSGSSYSVGLKINTIENFANRSIGLSIGFDPADTGSSTNRIYAKGIANGIQINNVHSGTSVASGIAINGVSVSTSSTSIVYGVKLSSLFSLNLTSSRICGFSVHDVDTGITNPNSTRVGYYADLRASSSELSTTAAKYRFGVYISAERNYLYASDINIISGDLSCDADATIAGDCNFNGNSNTTTVYNLVVKNDLDVTGDCTFNNNGTFGTTTVYDLIVNGDLDVSGTTTVNNLVINGTLSGINIPQFGSLRTSSTIGISDEDLLQLNFITFTSALTFNLYQHPGYDGQVLTIANDSGGSVAVQYRSVIYDGASVTLSDAEVVTFVYGEYDSVNSNWMIIYNQTTAFV